MPITGVAVCTRCAKELQEGWRLCPACGTPVDGATRTAFADASPSSGGVDEGRFPAGTVLAGRYKILGLIGHGGMGEVYRAFDQILNQAVALKFITGGELDDAALNRFRNEVRVARQVSHPNVCRVYDIGFVECTSYRRSTSTERTSPHCCGESDGSRRTRPSSSHARSARDWLPLMSAACCIEMPFVLTGWLAPRSLALQTIPILVAALALWAVLAAQPRRAIHA